MDRAGLVGADGCTHAGAFDLAYLCTLPNFVVMAAADEVELAHMVHTMALHDSGPSAVRYPRGNGRGLAMPATPERLEIGKGRIVREGKTVAILSLGTRLEEAEKAAEMLEAMGLSTTVADLRFAKPLDEALIRKLLTTHEVAVTIEEAAIGGFGAHVLTLASDEGLIDAGLKLRTMRLPDRFQDHEIPMKQYDEAGLNAPHIVDTVLEGASPQRHRRRQPKRGRSPDAGGGPPFCLRCCRAPLGRHAAGLSSVRLSVCPSLTRCRSAICLSYRARSAPSRAPRRWCLAGSSAETRQTMANIDASLKRRGLSMDSVVKCTVMLADMKDWPAFNKIYASYFKKGRYPARSALGVNGLRTGSEDRARMLGLLARQVTKPAPTCCWWPKGWPRAAPARRR